MSNYYDEIIERQVEQFNQQVEDAASLHKHLLEVLCSERLMAEYQTLRDPPMSIKPAQPTGFIRSTLQQAGKAGKWITKRVLLSHLSSHGPQTPTTRGKGQPTIIEGEYIVITDITDKMDTTETNKEDR